MPDKRHSDQDGMSARITGTKEIKDTVLFPSIDQLDTFMTPSFRGSRWCNCSQCGCCLERRS